MMKENPAPSGPPSSLVNTIPSEKVQQALSIASGLQFRATQVQTSAERRQQAELDRMLQHPKDKATLVQLTDQAFRPRSADRVAEQFTHILEVQGVPRFFNPLDRALLRGFQAFGNWLPGVSVPMVKEHLQHETANVILPAELELLEDHLERRREQGIRMNVNFLGEAILSEAEAARRMEQYLEAMRSPQTEVFSVKISTLYSQMSPLAREHTLGVLCDRLEKLYRTAQEHVFLRPDGIRVPKFLYLDMEEYRDLSLTCEAFMRTLDRPGLEKVAAGMALQAYIPDSALWQRRVNEWARRRVAAGGAPVTLRIVKGANLEMERVEASIRGWPQAPYKSKLETDANYKRMLHEGFRPENLAAVRLGIASHNLFDVAYALVLVGEERALDRVQFEMLEGMANAQRRALLEKISNLLLYAPACGKEQFVSAIAYLIRRLDENTGGENFLRHAFHLEPGSPAWKLLSGGFMESFSLLPVLSDAPRRTQDRALPVIPREMREFVNEPDTDWCLPQNGAWAARLLEAAREGKYVVPFVVAGREISSGRKTRSLVDPSRPDHPLGQVSVPAADEIDGAVEAAVKDEDGWRALTPAARTDFLKRVSHEIRKARGQLMTAALANTGKVFTESDAEVSEAVDFVEYYARSAQQFSEQLGPHVEARGKGVVVVVSPWNFPIAIPCGGVAAALAAGNTVILKPASDAVLPAWELCQCFWRAGVSQQTLQFLPCSGEDAAKLVQHPQVDSVILTGGTATALAMLNAKAEMHLVAETGGKNATIVTAMADRDQAIKNVLHSAFSHSGQKCSATSLLLLEAEVYDDPGFKRGLEEAIESLRVGSAWELATKMGPLIRPPAGELQTALTTLSPGESWAPAPRCLDGNPHLWTPGVKWGVQPGSVTHLTEFFGPVLGVMRFERLCEAIELVNATGYGLTSGLESLDDREQDEWREGIQAGNLYINRTTVGAVVLRQPFGGMGKSAFGAGIKAGGPNYVAQFMDFRETVPALPAAPRPGSELGRFLEALQGWDTLNLTENSRLVAAFSSYERAWATEFSQERDTFRLLGQDNLRRYLPVKKLRVRVSAEDTPFDLFARVAAGRVAGCELTVSVPPGTEWRPLNRLREATAAWAGAIEFVEESEADLVQAIGGRETDRVRYARPRDVPVAVRRAAAQQQVFVADTPVLMEGRIELLWYVREQSLSHDYHRYGNLGGRTGEARSLPD